MGSKGAMQDFVAGCCGGIAQVLSGHPLDTLKVRLQTQSATNPQFRGLGDVFMQTVRKEGVLGLYKGMSSPLLGVSFINAVTFFSYGISKRCFAAPGETVLPLEKVALSGAATGFAVAFVEGPFDLFKARLQVQYAGQAREYSNVFDVMRKLWAQRGPIGWYQGLSVTLFRNLLGNTAYFYFYEFFKRRLQQLSPSAPAVPVSTAASNVDVLVAGGLAGIMYWVSCYPLDVLKSKIQTDAVFPERRKYRGLLDCLSQTLRTEGARGLFRGFSPCLVRAFPANATCFLAYETAKRLLVDSSADSR